MFLPSLKNDAPATVLLRIYCNYDFSKINKYDIFYLVDLLLQFYKVNLNCKLLIYLPVIHIPVKVTYSPTKHFFGLALHIFEADSEQFS